MDHLDGLTDAELREIDQLDRQFRERVGEMQQAALRRMPLRQLQEVAERHGESRPDLRAMSTDDLRRAAYGDNTEGTVQ